MSDRSVLLRVLLLAAAASLVVVPGATAQVPGHTVAIEIQDLPDMAESNGTQVAVPFSIHATVSGASPCLATSGSSYTITLDAEVVSSTGNSTTAYVNPKQVTIAGPVLVPAAGGNAERTEEALLVISPGPYAGDGLNATVKVTATFSGGNGGCPGGSTAASSAEAEVEAGFVPVPSSLFGGGRPPSQEMPGPGTVLLLAVLGAVVLVLRRK